MKLLFVSISEGPRGSIEFDDECMFTSYTHALFCAHYLNRKSCYHYFLPCNFLHVTKSGSAKVEVLSRNGKIYTRYVSPNKVYLKKEIDNEKDMY